MTPSSPPAGHRTRSLLHGFAAHLPLTAVTVAALVGTTACSDMEQKLAAGRTPAADPVEAMIQRAAQRQAAVTPVASAPHVIRAHRAPAARRVVREASFDDTAPEPIEPMPRPRVDALPDDGDAAGEYVKDQTVETARRVRDDAVGEVKYHAREAAREGVHRVLRRIGM